VPSDLSGCSRPAHQNLQGAGSIPGFASARPVVGPVTAESLGGAGHRWIVESLELTIRDLAQSVAGDWHLACWVGHRDEVSTVERGDLPQCLQE
jgi:hypothetical protein